MCFLTSCFNFRPQLWKTNVFSRNWSPLFSFFFPPLPSLSLPYLGARSHSLSSFLKTCHSLESQPMLAPKSTKKAKIGSNRRSQLQSPQNGHIWFQRKIPNWLPKAQNDENANWPELLQKVQMGFESQIWFKGFGSRGSLEPLGTYPPFNLLVRIWACWRHFEALVKLKLMGPFGAKWRFWGLQELGWTILKLEQFLEPLEAMWASSRAVFCFWGPHWV